MLDRFGISQLERYVAEMPPVASRSSEASALSSPLSNDPSLDEDSFLAAAAEAASAPAEPVKKSRQKGHLFRKGGAEKNLKHVNEVCLFLVQSK